MNIHKRMAGPVCVISLDGKLDSHTTPTVHAAMPDLLPAKGQVLLDFTKVACMSGDGLRTALLVYRQAQGLESSVALVGLSADLKNVLTATGYLDFFVVADTVADALAALQEEIESAIAVEAAVEELADEQQPVLRT
jgi:anti-sigma B factor antagonist